MLNNIKLIKLVSILMIISIIFFVMDVGQDLFEHFLEGETYTAYSLLHLLFEILAVTSLVLGVYYMYKYKLITEVQMQTQTQQLSLLKGHFDSVLQSRFEEWNLTSAEKEITLFIIKGLNAAEIASARGTATGTVKAQTTSIFKKIGVSSKSELMSQLINEFLNE